MAGCMGRFAFAVLALMCVPIVCLAADGDEPLPRVGPYVFDLHLTVPRFTDDPLVAASRELRQTEMPGHGFGVDAGLHVYPLRIGPVTIGLGAAVTESRAS